MDIINKKMKKQICRSSNRYRKSYDLLNRQIYTKFTSKDITSYFIFFFLPKYIIFKYINYEINEFDVIIKENIKNIWNTNNRIDS